MLLQDTHGRHIHKLRVQLTDACNFRCFYCMPEGTRFYPAHELLAPGEIVQICSALNHLGVDEIRVTGGEPTVRAEFAEIMIGLAGIPWKKFGLTTNGYLLADKLSFLKDIGCHSLNISMDSLDAANFNVITRRPHFQKVLAAIIQAAEMGFTVKVNTVIAKGYNDHELYNFILFAEDHGVEVRFLELMKVGPAIEHHPGQFISADEMIQVLLNRVELTAVTSSIDSTSFGFQTQRGARIGFIASESKPFCGSCSRLRLTAKGNLRACLFSEAGIDLRNRPLLDYPEILREVMQMKPTGRLEAVGQSMNQIGG